MKDTQETTVETQQGSGSAKELCEMFSTNISYYGENLSCYLDLYPNQSMNFEEFSDGLKAIVDSDAYQYSDVINITFYSEDMWGTDYYYTFSVSESVTEEEIGEFLSRYGGVVYE